MRLGLRRLLIRRIRERSVVRGLSMFTRCLLERDWRIGLLGRFHLLLLDLVEVVKLEVGLERVGLVRRCAANHSLHITNYLLESRPQTSNAMPHKLHLIPTIPPQISILPRPRNGRLHNQEVSIKLLRYRNKSQTSPHNTPQKPQIQQKWTQSKS